MTTWLMRIGQYDQLVLHAMLFRRHRALDRVMRALTHIGDAVVMILTAAVLVFLVGPSLRQAGLQAAFALAASHAVVQILKRIVVRPRPRLPAGIALLIAAPDRFSFPSGHAAATLSIALPLAVALPGVLAALVVLLAVIVGVSRCYLGVHYPGDVIVGWALAASAVLAAPHLLTGIGLI